MEISCTNLTRRNTLEGSRKNISEHYDLGNEFYSLFLDQSMTYSSGIFRTPADSLEASQYEKYDRLCRNLSLKPTDHLLEIGSGWGGMAIHAAKNYGCKVTTVTISAEQFRFAKERITKEGLDHLVEIRLQGLSTHHRFFRQDRVYRNAGGCRSRVHSRVFFEMQRVAETKRCNGNTGYHLTRQTLSRIS